MTKHRSVAGKVQGRPRNLRNQGIPQRLMTRVQKARDLGLKKLSLVMCGTIRASKKKKKKNW